jgi:signal peptidase I
MLRFLVWLALLAAAVIGLARLTVLRWWRVPTDDPVLAASVSPTLRAGDLILLWRGTEPRFGSLVLCPDPEDPTRVVIGRIAGEAGDHVVIDGDNVTVNHERAHTEHACRQQTFTVIDPNTGNEVEQHCQIEAMGGVSHMRGALTGALRQRTEREVGAGRVFLLSDNRQYPLDSRHFGAVERRTCGESIFFRLVGRGGFRDVESRFTYIR